MATFSEIKTYIKAIVEKEDEELGVFYSKNMKEFAELTQDTEADTVLFIMDSPTVTSDNEYTEGGRVLRGYNIEFYVLKFAEDESTEDQIDVIYSEMESLVTQFFWKLNQGNTTIFNVDRLTTKRVKFITPNSFAGVSFILPSVRTACNL